VSSTLTPALILLGLVLLAIGALVVVGVVALVVTTRRRAVTAPAPGPLVLEAPATSATEAPAPRPSVEARLAELDDLVGRGVITDDERTAARARILAEG